MSIGLKRGTVQIEKHQTEWEQSAATVICLLKEILQDSASDVQHVGSTAIKSIMAKPIIDIAVAVRSYDAVLAHLAELEEKGIIFRRDDRPRELLFVVMGTEPESRTHHIHVIPAGSEEWKRYLNFRDYLNAVPAAAERYERIKKKLAYLYPNDRGAYTEGKAEMINELLEEAAEWRKSARE